jgi:hypothetical protein
MPARPTETGSQLALQHEINSCRRKLAFQTAVRRLLVLLALAAVPPLLFVVADHSEPAGVQRATALTIAYYWRWLLGLGCLALLVATFRRRLNPLFAARALERASGIDHNSVVNAVLLQRQPGAAYASAAAADQATAELSQHWPPRVAEAGALRLPLMLAAVVVLAWIGYALLAPKPVWPSVARFFGSNLPPPTATILEQVRPRPGEAVHAGQSLALEFAARGGTVRQVTFEVLDASLEEQAARYEMKPSAQPNANWELTLAPHEVSRDIHYRCAANDAVLTGTIPVLPVPMLTGLEIELQPPAYSGLPVQVVSNPDLDVLAGTRATFWAFANTLVENATFVLSNSRETRTRMDLDPDDPRRFKLSLLLVEGGEYQIEFHDPLGEGVKDPPTHHITLRPDSAPTVKIVEPPDADIPDAVVDVTRQPVLAAVAEDDVRLAGSELVRADAGVLVRTTLDMQLEANGRRGRVRVPTADLPLRPGQQMRAWFEVHDSRTLLDGTPAPQTARSRELILTRPAETARNHAHVDHQPPAAEEKPPPPEKTAADKPESRPAGNQPLARGPGGHKSDQATSTGPSSDKGESAGNSSGDEDLEGELKRFVKENGGMARDLGRRTPKSDANGEPADGESQHAPESQPANNPPPRQTPQSQPATSPAGGQQEHPSERSPTTQPETGGTPQSQPASQPAAPSNQPTSPSAGHDQPNPDRPDAQPDQPSGPAQRQGKPDEDTTDQNSGPAQSDQRTEGDKTGQSPEQSAAESQPGPGSGYSGTGTGDRHTDEQTSSQPASPLQPPSQPNWRERTKPLETEGLTETLDLLEWLDRGGTVDESVLIDLGWPADRVAAFSKALQRLHEQARQAGGLGELRKLRVHLALGDPNVQRGTGLSSAAQTTVDQPAPHPDNLRRIAPPPEQEVPAELRPLLDAYYRALAERQKSAPH